MRRTWKKTAFVLAAWTLAAAACLAAWTGGYNLGWLQGYKASPTTERARQSEVPLAGVFDKDPADEQRGFIYWLIRFTERTEADGSVVVYGPLPRKASGG
jgi:hypothetical protein